MLGPVDNFFVTPVDHWPLLGVTQVTTGSLDHVATSWIMVATLGALKALGRGLEFPLKATFEALVNRSIGP